MFIDARTIPDNQVLETDVCIIGAGAAGITLAREFIDRPFRVSMLESGDFEYNQETQSLYEGENVGLPYYPLQASRLRYFGGTTNHWGGTCRPFDDFDFEKRDWIPYSGWPIRRSDLEPYYDRARTICQLSSAEWDTSYWQERDKSPALPSLGDQIVSRLAQIVPTHLRSFGKNFRDEILQAQNIITYLNANVTEIETDDTAQTVSGVRVACLAGNQFSITAKIFVLAVGGIENPRLLLLSNKRQPNGLGNQNGLVGRFFLEHPRFEAGIILPSNPHTRTDFYEPHLVGNSKITGYLSLSEETRRREELVDVQIKLRPVYEETYVKAAGSKDVASLRYLVKAFRGRKSINNFDKHAANVVRDMMSWQKLIIPGAPTLTPDPMVIAQITESGLSGLEPLVSEYLGDIALFAYGKIFNNIPIQGIRLLTRIEPVPNPESRVTLSTERDRLGQNRVRLDWRLSPLDKRSVIRTLEILGAEAGRAGFGRLQIKIDDDDTTWPADIRGGWHHMGTTRMSDDPRQGVVDGNCQMHGISNLFVAGSSVFPTPGSGTPTLTLTALALRLADHIKGRMK
ncbi:MAG: GMC family oxidoreductase [Ardenticatenaceae bacterium]|nr:GMC family oxidoreductase [Ardenticatenaceae bacterium]HBY96448.1 GMC family oxidoreductase [Chloroflexota bacterium]